MKKAFSIGKYIVKENLSNKILNGFIVFAGLLILGTMVLKDLSIYKSDMVVKDSGIFLIEFFIFLVTVLSSSTYIIRDHKEKSIYLVLTKPVSRTEYIYGNLIGNILLIGIYTIIMTFLLQGALLVTGASFNILDLVSILFIFIKISILASIGIFFAIISDSYVTANIFTFSIYIISHFTKDLVAISDKTSNFLVKGILNILYYILPRFSLLNLKDIIVPVEINYGLLLSYSLVYIFIITQITALIFEKRKL